MTKQPEAQGIIFDEADITKVSPQADARTTFEELQRPTRRYMARLATAGLEPQTLEGMVPAEVEKQSRELQRLAKRAAVSPAMTPDYWAIDEARFANITEEDYEQSSPDNLALWLYARTDQSMRQTDVRSAWVLLSAGEKATIVNIPHEYAAGAEAKHRTRSAVALKSHNVVQRDAVEEGAKALESRLESMQNLSDTYASDITRLRALKGMLEHTWMANASSGLAVREATTVLREGVRELLTAIATVDNWSEEKLQKALIGLDMRLTAGDTRKRQQEKTAEWRELTRLYGNHLLAKKVLVRDRIAKCHEEISKRRQLVLK